MHFAKRKKIVTLLVVASTIASSSGVASLIYNFSKDNDNPFEFVNKESKPNLINKDQLELDNDKILNSNVDLNLRVKPQPKEEPVIPKPKEEEKKPIIIEKQPEKPIEKPKIIEKPIPKPIEKPKRIPKPIEPPAPTPQPKPEPQPEVVPDPTPGVADAYITIEGVRVKAKLKNFKKRVVSSYDVENKIANREEYLANITGELISIEPTEELRKKVTDNAAAAARTIRDHEYSTIGMALQVLDLVDKGKMTETNLHSFLIKNELNNWNWRRDYYTFQVLIEHGDFQKFLTPEAQAQYPTMQFRSDLHRKLWIIKNLDFSKFTKLAPEGERFLREGKVLDPRNVYLNERGEWTSSSWSGPKEFNGVIAERERNNSQKRAFDYDTPWGRSADDINSGTYPGWTKTKINPDQDPNFKDLHISNINGLDVFRMTRNGQPKTDGDYVNDGYVVEIDASKSNAYERTKTLVKELTDRKVNITSYRIKHMGKANAAQNFKEILLALPEELRQLELFFDARATNTSSLIALENKKIKELSLYTDGNSLLDSWSLNPWALKETAWVNTLDYNVSSEYPSDAYIITRIRFDTLAFEESDINKSYADDDPTNRFKRINDGLRRAYWARNNEAIFQSMGPGLNPDNNESGNGYPMGLDFGRAPSVRTLRGLVFKDIIKPQNGSRKIQRANFANTGQNYKLKLIDLNDSGFENFIPKIPGVQEPKITFSNGDETKYLFIDDAGQLTSNGVQSISKFFELAKTLNKTIRVRKGNIQTIQSLRNYGFDVEEFEEGDELNFT
ncbi:putative immunoglobulin-blocking virulence protein [Mycoplasma sp. CSL7503-lung]|uniref:putative immunoglobulin-blocking virulence protein n=1 Tax=Mycoplasma sp. CSL7503-lung TaxID=536372 RepID=UPI0021CF0A6C|nr:putative immunoglobulin-blocking virulence protein [Mycoplasma sp. CSL7503-lung]MCU4706571.1 putative immunoglobulin-blocking virulence protein [Mycoplasma sp. CSL7503-lung]